MKQKETISDKTIAKVIWQYITDSNGYNVA